MNSLNGITKNFQSIASYSGYLDFQKKNEITNDLLSKLKELSVSKETIKKSLFIIDESLMNILDYYRQNNMSMNNTCGVGVYNFDKKIKFEISSLIKKQDKEILNKQINDLNNKDNTDIKTSFKNRLSNTIRIGYENNAGLGMLMIKSKTGYDFFYRFYELTNDIFVFKLKVFLNNE